MTVLIRGYATLYNVPVTVQGDECEVIQEGAFASILDRPCPLFFDSHDDDAPRLGETTLMFEDASGLAFEAELPPNASSMLAQIVSGKTALCSVCMTHRKYDTFDGAQIVTSSRLDHIAVTSKAAYGDTAVWRADVSLDDAPWRIRQWAARWEEGYQKYLAAKGPSVPPGPIGKRPIAASAEAVAAEQRFQMKLKAIGGHPHHVVRPASARKNGKKPSTLSMLATVTARLVRRLIALEEKVAEMERKQ